MIDDVDVEPEKPPEAPPAAPESPTTTTEEESSNRPRASQAFWTLFVALPAAFSILRLWVESGGQLQTTLLLVSHVSAANLIAALFTTGTRVVTGGLVAIFAIGSVLDVSAKHAPAGSRMRKVRPLFARWTAAVPGWFIAGTFALALCTWKILYLPLLAPALMATVQTFKFYQRIDDPRGLKRIGFFLAAATAYGWLVQPTVVDAFHKGLPLAIVLLTLPVLLAALVTGPVPAKLATVIAVTVQPVLLVLLMLATVPVLTTPVLPLSVTVTEDPDRSTPEYIRGHVIDTTDTSTVILQEHGGVRYVPNETITDQELCPLEDELPRYRLRIQDLHVEDSLLEALGRRVRPISTTGAACRVGSSG